jgi:predicted porin
MKKLGKTWSATLPIVTALGLGALAVPGAANAADLGGNCCADLEERIAELEATTARKGNRKVSLEVSGWVTQQLMGWDDGEETGAYVVDSLTDLGSQIHFAGKAQISQGWSAGYNLFLNTQTAESFSVDQNNDDAGENISVLQSYWWLQSDRLGKLSIGLQSHATDNISVLDLSGAGSLFAANVVSFDGAGMFLRPEDGTGLSSARWQSVGHCLSIGAGIFGDCHGDRSNAVRYDTPVYAGFQASASWGEDDFWDVALRYNGDVGPFKITFGAGYLENRDEESDVTPDVNAYQIGASVLHSPTGLFFNVAWGEEEPVGSNSEFADTQQLYLKGGWRAKLNPLGATVFYGEYGRDKDMYGALALGASACAAFDGAGGSMDLACANAVDATVDVTGSEFDRWGVGIVQEIDAASMSIWAKYKTHSGDIDFSDAGVAGKQDLERLDQYLVGGVIFY